MCPVFLFMPLFFAKDLASSRVTPASATVETKPPIGPANDVREENRKPTQPEAPADATTARPAKTELVPAWDPMLLASAASHGVAVDSNGEFDLTYGELLAHPMTWLLTIFFTTILTPGWGIKLSSVAIMRTFFQASVPYAEQITALYSAFYCVGRFVGGLVAERIGNSRAYDIMLVLMLVGPFVAKCAIVKTIHPFIFISPLCYSLLRSEKKERPYQRDYEFFRYCGFVKKNVRHSVPSSFWNDQRMPSKK
jgi:hypothetical protein